MSLAPVGLASVSAVAALTFSRVFTETSSAVPAVLAALSCHAVMQLAWRRRWAVASTAVAVSASVALVAVWSVAPHTTAYGVPTPATVSLLGDRLTDGFGALTTAEVPIGPHSGLVLLAALGAALAAVAAEWVAFRARALLSAVIPGATLFTITAALGTGRFESAAAGGFVAAVLVFMLAHAPAQAGETHAWFRGRDVELRPARVLWAGLPVVIVAAVAAPWLGPRLPDARSAGLIDLTPAEGPRTRVTVSPLIDIRDRLTQTPKAEVFTVTADRPAYWRMAALETWDGQIWSSLADYESADSTLPDGGTADAESGEELVQRYRIDNLAQFWLPAAYRPVQIDLPGARVNPQSLTLLTDEETADGLEYTVVSRVRRSTRDDLRGATGHVPDDVRPMLALPADTPAVVRSLALEVTSGQPTPYDAALTLQDWFRANFTYSEAVPPGHSGDSMTDFLLVGRAGFCEQFSSSFAVMARSLGIPARVAVGFTPGNLIPATTTYRVTTAEAHAWPEVWLAPFGWVAFEPTPTRSSPLPSDHSGTYDAGAQERPARQTLDDTTETTIATGNGRTPPPTAPESEPLRPTPGDASGDAGPWSDRLALFAAVVAVVTVGGGLVAVRYAHRRRREWLESLGPRDAVLVRWELAVDRLRRDGVDVSPSLTPAETVVVAAAHRPSLWAPLDSLRELVDLAAYALVEPGPGDVERTRQLLREVEAVLAEPRESVGT